MSNLLGNSLYIHIPFCKRRCLYCDFYSIVHKEEVARDYINVIVKQIENLDTKFSTVYIGGGTPTILNITLLEKLLDSLTKYVSCETEFTIEANPESLDEEKIKLFLNRNVNRLSIGVQSFIDEKLKKLGRIHTAKEAKNKIALAKKLGFNNISVDLIFGAWDDNIEDWKEDLQEAVALPVTHISCYALTYEKNTPLWSLAQAGKIVPMENEIAAGMYEYAISYLSQQGFSQYEVSNFARAGLFCRHNVNYWHNNEYIGIGPSAVSYKEGRRLENTHDVYEYIDKSKKGQSAVISCEKLSDIQKARETAALKIRTKEGIGCRWFSEKTGFDFLELEQPALKKLVCDGLVEYKRQKRRIQSACLTQKGFLFCDIVSAEFL